MSASARRAALHQADVGPEAELLVEGVRVARVQDPAPLRVRTVLDDLPHELDAEPETAELVEHVDVGEVHEAGGVAVHGAGEADLAAVAVEAHDAGARSDQLVLAFAGPALGPVGLAAEIGVDGLAVEAGRVVVELESVVESTLHDRSGGHMPAVAEKEVRVDEVRAFNTRS